MRPDLRCGTLCGELESTCLTPDQGIVRLTGLKDATLSAVQECVVGFSAAPTLAGRPHPPPQHRPAWASPLAYSCGNGALAAEICFQHQLGPNVGKCARVYGLEEISAQSVTACMAAHTKMKTIDPTMVLYSDGECSKISKISQSQAVTDSTTFYGKVSDSCKGPVTINPFSLTLVEAAAFTPEHITRTAGEGQGVLEEPPSQTQAPSSCGSGPLSVVFQTHLTKTGVHLQRFNGLPAGATVNDLGKCQNVTICGKVGAEHCIQASPDKLQKGINLYDESNEKVMQMVSDAPGCSGGGFLVTFPAECLAPVTGALTDEWCHLQMQGLERSDKQSDVNVAREYCRSATCIFRPPPPVPFAPFVVF
jgi:hypothetical protein